MPHTTKLFTEIQDSNKWEDVWHAWPGGWYSGMVHPRLTWLYVRCCSDDYPRVILVKTRDLILKLICRSKEARIVQAIF
jgi:hypothetical protein